MPTNGNGQFDYPANPWSAGKMRKKGQQPDFDYAFQQTAAPAGAEMTPAQQVFERSRPELGESASGKATPTPSDVTMGSMMLRNPVGQVVSVANFLGDTTVGKKIKSRISDLLSAGASKEEIHAALKPYKWSVHQTEAQ